MKPPYQTADQPKTHLARPSLPSPGPLPKAQAPDKPGPSDGFQIPSLDLAAKFGSSRKRHRRAQLQIRLLLELDNPLDQLRQVLLNPCHHYPEFGYALQRESGKNPANPAKAEHLAVLVTEIATLLQRNPAWAVSGHDLMAWGLLRTAQARQGLPDLEMAAISMSNANSAVAAGSGDADLGAALLLEDGAILLEMGCLQACRFQLKKARRQYLAIGDPSMAVLADLYHGLSEAETSRWKASSLRHGLKKRLRAAPNKLRAGMSKAVAESFESEGLRLAARRLAQYRPSFEFERICDG